MTTNTENDPRDSTDGLRNIAASLNTDVPTMRGFSLLFQPQVDRKWNVVGAESLLRWQPECGHVVGPDLFVPLLEASHHIHAAGEWVIDRSLEGLLALRARGFALRDVSINVSAWQINAHFFAHLMAKTVALGIDPSEVVLELTERQAVADAGTYNIIATLRAVGFRWDIDDFGTGYASIRYLRKKQFTGLKIDRSMLTATDEPPGLLAGVCAMAHAIDMRVVGEGVETVEQFQRLGLAGCDLFQGFLFGKPTPVDEWRHP